MRSGFSLVELSIVLVILGLLTGGILGGQALIRAAELRAVSTEVQRYITATQTFRDKYFALPGDMTNATAFWGKDTTNCNAQPGNAGTPGTCNGDGNGQLQPAAAAGLTGEINQYWKQLALAGLIEGTYSGLAGASGHRDAVLGTNSPRSKLGRAGYSIEWGGTITGNANPVLYDGTYNNYYIFGGQQVSVPPEAPVIKPEEAWNIDTKMDDGRARTGNVKPFYRYNYLANVCANATDEYNLNNSSNQCNLAFVSGF